jgi:hypothetical protein
MGEGGRRGWIEAIQRPGLGGDGDGEGGPEEGDLAWRSEPGVSSCRYTVEATMEKVATEGHAASTWNGGAESEADMGRWRRTERGRGRSGLMCHALKRRTHLSAQVLREDKQATLKRSI